MSSNQLAFHRKLNEYALLLPEIEQNILKRGVDLKGKEEGVFYGSRELFHEDIFHEVVFLLITIDNKKGMILVVLANERVVEWEEV